MAVNRRTIWLLALALPLVSGCPHPYRPYNYAAEPDPRQQEFVIGPSDVLRITVWRNPDLSGEAVVRPDGTITVPVVGDLAGAGGTPAPIRGARTQQLPARPTEQHVVRTRAVARGQRY